MAISYAQTKQIRHKARKETNQQNPQYSMKNNTICKTHSSAFPAPLRIKLPLYPILWESMQILHQTVFKDNWRASLWADDWYFKLEARMQLAGSRLPEFMLLALGSAPAHWVRARSALSQLPPPYVTPM